MATKYDLEILVRTKKQGTGVKDAEQEIEGFGRRLNSTLGVIEASAAAALAAGLTFKQAFDMSREGASLLQLEASFNRFNDAVIKTPDLLEQFNAAADGTIAKSELMSGLLTLTAGASEDYSRALAGAYPQLIEIARASSALNPALGDTSFMLESLTTAAKRQSVPIADNLGLIIKMETAVREVHPALQTLATDYDDLSQQQKFLNELLFQGDVLINQTGGSVDSMTDSWDRLTVKVLEGVEGLQRWLAEGLMPIIDAASGEYGETVEGIIDANVAAAGSVDDLVEQYKKIQGQMGFGSAVTGVTDDLEQGLTTVERAILANVGSADELVDAMWRIGRLDSEAGYYNEQYWRTLYERNQEMMRFSPIARGYIADTEAVSAATEDATQTAVYGMTEWNHTVSVQQQQALGAARAMEERAAALEAEAEALQASKEQLADYFVEAQNAEGEAMNLNTTLYDMLAAGGASAEGLAIAGVALGQFDEDAANAYLKTAMIKQGLDDIAAAAMADGEITVQEMIDIRTEVDNLVTSVNEIPDIAYTDIIVRTEEAKTKLDEIKTKVDEVTAARELAINVFTNVMDWTKDAVSDPWAVARSKGAE